MSFKPEEVSGLVRTEQKKGDENRDKPYTATLVDGRRVRLDASEARALENRLAKDKSRMERDGTRAREREPEKRSPNRQASQADTRAFLDQFERKR